MSIRRVDVGVINMAIGSLLATVFFAVGVRNGIIGLAYSWVLFYPPFFLMCLFNVARVTGISMVGYWKNIMRIILNVVCMSLIIFFFQHLFDSYIVNSMTVTWMQLYRLIGTTITGVASFLLFILLVDYKTFKEVIFFIRHRTITS